MSRIRDAYLDAADSAVALLSDPAVAAAWDRPSVLAEFSVRGLAGHLASQVFFVSQVLAAAAPVEAPLSVAEFFSGAAAFHADRDTEINLLIRRGGEAAAVRGADALVAEVASTALEQRTLLAAEPAGRVVSYFGRPFLLDDFLLTRLVELVVHSDDLAVSVDIATPALPAQVFEPVLDTLARLAVSRHGQSALLRALSRAERAPATIAGI